MSATDRVIDRVSVPAKMTAISSTTRNTAAVKNIAMKAMAAPILNLKSSLAINDSLDAATATPSSFLPVVRSKVGNETNQLTGRSHQPRPGGGGVGLISGSFLGPV